MTDPAEERRVSDEEFTSHVAAYRPSTLIPLIATASAQWKDHTWWDTQRYGDDYLPYRPWALAEVARASLVYGSELGRDATARDLLALLNDHNMLADPLADVLGVPSADQAWKFMLRLTGEQLPFQEHVWANLARTAAVLEFTDCDKPAKVLLPGWDTALLGCSLTTYVGVAHLVYAAVANNRGRFDPFWLSQPHWDFVTRVIDAQTITDVAARHFAVAPAAFREADAAARVGGDRRVRRFGHNPLRTTPLVSGYGSGYLTPCSHLITPKATLLGLYYTGVEVHGDAFARDLGNRFEQYIGRQLQLLSGATVHPEISYGPKRSRSQSVDWIVVFPDLVLLVEVKSTRPVQQLRLGSDASADKLRGMLGKAYQQIDTTAAHIAARKQEFAHIPTDRPLHGLVVTMEPFAMANLPFQISCLPAHTTFTTLASAGEVERFVLAAEPSRLLLERAADADGRTYSLGAVGGLGSSADNPLLAKAWASYPWASPPQQASNPLAIG
ncbi:nuclease-related domain-containing protein [Streptomyces hygroscopicus]|uniref:nuclease-related domain-containing protein n=1 Tax=Streptomyces hygroscopicus TaxID=1912 RepID=UPI0007851D38|nr:nuclease-related domain-containing protein [Streptomyces hygroscopicus]